MTHFNGECFEAASVATYVYQPRPQDLPAITLAASSVDWARTDACHAATPREGVARVRLPGERGLALMREQREHGLGLHPSILPALAPWADKLGVALPPPR